MWPNPQFHGDLVTFTEDILNGNILNEDQSFRERFDFV